ncbi:hypothetical protein [Nocardioides sp. WS12]|uniref:hypothetical protein n=1 Tax=Nocardioides sp. WS12 TaxID=2486272 RepID=UPI0015F8D8FE|nr:hypothetical protein [Nocardioides sp. WS12]
MTTSHVEVSGDSIRRAWKARGHDDFWLRLRTPQTGELDAVERSVAAANAAAEQDAIDPRAYSFTPCPGGFAIEIGPVADRPQIDRWVDLFTGALEAHGLSGSLGGATEARRMPKAIRDGRPVPTLFAQFRLPSTHSTSQPGWHVGVAQTEEIVRRTVEWATTDPGKVVLTQNSFSVAVDASLGLQAPMERALHAAGSAGLDVSDTRSARVRHAVLGPNAVAHYQSIGPRWDAVVDELRDLATSLPAPLDYAFLRVANRGILGIHGIDTVQPLDGIQELHVRYNAHLLDRFLPDAHGFQIVTDTHLHAAHDLSDWVVTDLGNGQHLVTASDLDPWYSATQPDPTTLARARSDWAGALLTLANFEAYGPR